MKNTNQRCVDTIKLHKTLKENIFKMDTDKLEKLDLRAASAIRLSLTKNILAHELDKSIAKKS